VQKAAGALARVDELLDEPASIADRPGAVELPPLAQEIRFHTVAFGYGGTQPILRDLDLVLPAGQHTAIVGPSGSGKTSILNLLLRFWDPETGSILFDGRDIRDATLASLRSRIGLVFQDTFLFDTTVRENIALGTSGATDADVVQAARAAKLDHYIQSLPAGYDTMLGERGVRMSGGQRQRLAIARALIRDPTILVFDEATSALDAETEREILATLALVARNRTTVTITHRLSVAATADRIAVLDQGRVVREGTHAELIREDGLYRRLYEQQTAAAPRAVEGSAVAGAELLRRVPLFAGLASEPLALLGERFAVTSHEAGVDIVREGERGERFFIVAEGRLDVLVRDADSGEELRVNALETGDYFGELALLTEERRSATVRTMAATELYALDRSDFAALLEREPGVRDAVMATLSRRRVDEKMP
jgi:ATP-binding cassette subfamily B protein